MKETRDGIKVTSMTTGFSPVTAYSDEQVSPQTLYDVLGSLEQTQAVQRQAVHKAVISGDGARADAGWACKLLRDWCDGVRTSV